LHPCVEPQKVSERGHRDGRERAFPLNAQSGEWLQGLAMILTVMGSLGIIRAYGTDLLSGLVAGIHHLGLWHGTTMFMGYEF
jgi:hypothetical protein